jgi:hypothetical protein
MGNGFGGFSRATRRSALGAVAVPAALGLAGCQINPFSRIPSDQTLRTWLWTYRTLDPIQAQGTTDAEYVVHIFSGLVTLNESWRRCRTWRKTGRSATTA